MIDWSPARDRPSSPFAQVGLVPHLSFLTPRRGFVALPQWTRVLSPILTSPSSVLWVCGRFVGKEENSWFRVTIESWVLSDWHEWSVTDLLLALLSGNSHEFHLL
jgi:hypothetical protein